MIRNFLISTRPAEKSDSAVDQCGILIRNFPVTRIVSYGHDGSLERELCAFNPDSFAFTSEVGVRIFLDEYPGIIQGPSTRLFAIGEKTARALESRGYDPVYPEKKDSVGLAELIISYHGTIKRVALIRSRNADSVLVDRLTEAGVTARDFHIYEVVRSTDANLIVNAIGDGGFTGIIVTSPMEAQILFELVGKSKLEQLPIYAIGETTRQRLASLGIEATPPYGESDFTKLVEKIADKLKERK